jgi:hypothetical protein
LTVAFLALDSDCEFKITTVHSRVGWLLIRLSDCPTQRRHRSLIFRRRDRSMSQVFISHLRIHALIQSLYPRSWLYPSAGAKKLPPAGDIEGGTSLHMSLESYSSSLTVIIFALPLGIQRAPHWSSVLTPFLALPTDRPLLCVSLLFLLCLSSCLVFALVRASRARLAAGRRPVETTSRAGHHMASRLANMRWCSAAYGAMMGGSSHACLTSLTVGCLFPDREDGSDNFGGKVDGCPVCFDGDGSGRRRSSFRVDILVVLDVIVHGKSFSVTC